MNIPSKNRIESIDVLRGLVMIIMALDHVRDYFHIAANTDDPLNLVTTTPILFFTRWITHFCAPVFVFLSGTSVYLQGLRKSKKELSIFLMKRGLWLIFIELAIITFAWSFNPAYNVFFFQVIWAIGISMFVMGLLIRLPFNIILSLGILIVFGHNILDFPESAQGFQAGFWWDLLHYGRFTPFHISENHDMLMVYPFVPWLGLMMLGYCFGKLLLSAKTIEERRRKLNILGVCLILFFTVLRFSNLYGDPVPWTPQKNFLYTFFSFINVFKYPPSLLYMCITIGPALLVLSLFEKIRNRFTDTIKIYGRVAFFYYILHLYLIHTLSMIAFFIRGHNMNDAYDPKSHFPFYFEIPGEGYNLPVVYAVWILVILALYPLCKKYDRYKTEHREKWWLSYL
jgi:uncharacterized membrane protein